MTAAALTAGGWVRKDARGRTYQPVRGQSQALAPHEFEAEPITHEQADMQIAAVEELAAESKVPGKRRGSDGNLSRLEVRVYAYLVRWQARTGRVFPSYEQIAAALRTTARCALVAIRKLKAWGLIRDWVRRCVRTDRPAGEPGPQVEQTSNFYFMGVPRAVRDRIAQWERERRRRRDAAQETERQRKDRLIAEMKAGERRDGMKAKRQEHAKRKAAKSARAMAWWDKLQAKNPAVAKASAAADAARNQAAAAPPESRRERDNPEG